MTVETFTPASIYTVAGIGPYAIGHPYTEGSIRAFVTVGGVEVALEAGDIIVTPAAAAVSGSLFLSAGAAATHAGRALRIERDTTAEQGWVGVLGEREKGLETQLDRLTYVVQELDAVDARTLRTRDPIPAFVPEPNRLVGYDGTKFVSSLTIDEIVAAAAGPRADGARFTPATFGALPRGSDGGVDQSPQVQAAMNFCGAAKVPLYFDEMYLCNGLTQVSDLTCIGDGGGIVSLAIISVTVPGFASGQHVVNASGKTNFIWDGVVFDAGNNTAFISGLRVLSLFNCTKFQVRNCNFTSNGAAVGAVRCSEYVIENNHALVQGLYAPGGIPTMQHDGIFDNWDGSHDFKIINNVIVEGNTPARYPILVTGTSSLPVVPARVYNGLISGNRIQGYNQCGIWIMGRTGGADGFIVSDNHIFGGATSTNAAIIVSEAKGVVVTGNYIKDAVSSGIRVYTEGPGGEPPFTLDQSAIVITGNVIVDANANGAADGDTGSAIMVRSDTTFAFIGGNAVVGTEHVYALYLSTFEGGSTGVSLGPNAFQSGTLGVLGFSGELPAMSGFVTTGGEARVYAAGKLRLTTDGDDLTVRAQATETQRLFVGAGRAGDGNSELRLQASVAGGEGLTLAAYAGANGVRELRSNGTGTLQIVTQDAAPIALAINGTNRFIVGADGVVQFGTRTPSADAPITGFIEVKDSGGVVRRLAVIG